MGTKIEWCDEVWNPVTGCTPISEGCDHCYAKRMANRLKGRYGYPADDPFRPGTFHPDKIDINVWPPGKRVFVGSMGDLFHEGMNIRGNEMREVFRVMAAHDNTFMLLTKRPARMKEAIKYFYGEDFAEQMPNVWVGVSVENQRHDDRIMSLKGIPAAVRFVSFEPLVGPFNFLPPWLRFVDWAIIGGESGPKARIMHPEWPRTIISECQAAGIPVFFKQWGEYNALGQKVGKKEAGSRILGGQELKQFPK